MKAWEEEFLAYMQPYVTENKKQLIDEVLYNRTRYLTLVVEHMIKPHNGSATLRTAECMGLQSAHIVSTKNLQNNLGIVKGATKWLDIHHHQAETEAEATTLAINALKPYYKVVVTSPHAGAYLPETLPVDEPIALWLGNEQEGASEIAMEAADYTVKIPMFGFTESYNVSVSAAICLYAILNRLRNQHVINWKLSEEEVQAIRLAWYEKLVRHASRVKPIIQKKHG